MIKNKGLVDRAVEALRAHVVEGSVEPGAALPSQGELCRRLGVSRTVVREAMRVLQSQGFVKLSQGRLSRVLPASTSVVVDGLGILMERSQVGLLDVQAVRRPLEIAVAVAAATRATPAQIEQLKQANAALKKAVTMESQILADMCFHQLLAESSGNPVFGIVLDVLSKFLHESRRKTLSLSGIKVALKHHEALVKALEQRDKEAARIAAEEGMDQTERDLRAQQAPRHGTPSRAQTPKHKPSRRTAPSKAPAKRPGSPHLSP
jgi:GntR family transcriptional repressor for pyruvate dehydrogenase complex